MISGSEGFAARFAEYNGLDQDRITELMIGLSAIRDLSYYETPDKLSFIFEVDGEHCPVVEFYLSDSSCIIPRPIIETFLAGHNIPPFTGGDALDAIDLTDNSWDTTGDPDQFIIQIYRFLHDIKYDR